MTLPSPTPAERTAIKTAYAALRNSKSPTSYIVEQAVYALGAAQLLMDPETAEELRKLRARVAELEAMLPADGISRRQVPLQALREDEAVRRSVDAQFPVVAAFLAQDLPAINAASGIDPDMEEAARDAWREVAMAEYRITGDMLKAGAFADSVEQRIRAQALRDAKSQVVGQRQQAGGEA